MSRQKSDLDRRTVIRRVLELDGDVKRLAAELREFPFDSDVPYGKLEVGHLIKILERFLRAEIDEETLEFWANLVEGRDDIEIEAMPAMQEVLFALANPVLEGPITVTKANDWLSKLS